MPKIVVTGRGNVTDRVVDLEIGADDYVVKPFEPSELVARISRLRKKLRGDPGAPKLIRTVYGAGYVFSAPVQDIS